MLPRIVVLTVLVLVHLAHVLHHAVSVLLVRADQGTNALRIKIRVWHYRVNLAKVVLRASMVDIGSMYDPRRTLMFHIVRVTVTRSEPLILNGSSFWLIAKRGCLFLFLVVHVLVLKIT